MKYRFIFSVFFAFAITLVLFPDRVVLAKNEGLYISPLHQELILAAGQTKTGSFMIANLTKQSMVVDLEVQRFHVTDRTYDYIFTDPVNNWINLPVTQYKLAPGQKESVPYTVTVAKNAASGGYYSALLASTNMSTGSVDGTVRVGSLLYMTIEGKGVSRSGAIQDAAIPWIVMGTEIPYSYDAKNTGNVHTDARFFANLKGLFGDESVPTNTRTILPGSIRRIDEKMSSPIFPGVYKMTYGYIDEVQKISVQNASYVVFIPPWSVAAVLLMIMTGLYLWQKRRRSGNNR